MDTSTSSSSRDLETLAGPSSLTSANFDGVLVAGIAYGINFTLVCFTVPRLYRQFGTSSPLNTRRRRLSLILLASLFLMFISSTLLLVGLTAWLKDMLIGNGRRDPDLYFENEAWVTSKKIANVGAVGVVWANLGLITYRAVALYQFKRLYVSVASSAYIVAVVLSILFLIQSFSPPSSNPFPSISLLTPFTTLVVSTDICLALAILARFVSFKKINNNNGNNHDNYGIRRLVIICMESSALGTGFGLFFLIAWITGSPLRGLVFGVLGQVKLMASALVMLRVTSEKENSVPKNMNTNDLGSSAQAHLDMKDLKISDGNANVHVRSPGRVISNNDMNVYPSVIQISPTVVGMPGSLFPIKEVVR